MEPQRIRSTRNQFKCKIYEQLSKLLAKLNPPSPMSLSQNDLQNFHIQCSAMTLLPEEEPDAGPLFCDLVLPSTMNKAFDTSFTDNNTIEWPEYDPSSNFYAALAVEDTLLSYSMSGQDVREPLVHTEWYSTGETSGALTLHRNFYPDTRKQWGVDRILRVDNSDQPHLACLHLDNAPAEDGLRSSELISAIKLMKQAMRLDKLNQFCVNPVYVYSFSAHKVRILETYYEADTLFVSKTPYIDFAEENKENIKLFLRWMMSKPSGLTKFADRNVLGLQPIQVCGGV